ncbi:hypothetical protein [Herbihabitans rhizosphaerae]|uniref:hypothetical protein n=1 Tax=Herbihabitans rhizosphaerae TaxID=1872711 RepID=UPI00102B0083|nr:hypothetical protein [Herbihabitans rhizosphaerae]
MNPALNANILQARLRTMRELLDDLAKCGSPSAEDLAPQRINQHAAKHPDECLRGGFPEWEPPLRRS